MTDRFPLVRKKRVLVTGATGVIGTHLCRRLYNEGAEVHALSRSTTACKENSYVERWHSGDLRDRIHVHRIMREVGPDLVLHFAAQVTGSRDRSLVYQMVQNNVVASINLLDAATKEECDRIVLAGSLEEPNTSSEAALSPYAATKLAVTNFARMYHRVYATPVTVARIAMVYGPGCGQDRLIPYTITELMEDRSPSISSGDRSVDWVFIDDVVEGTLVTATTDQSVGKTIDIGTGTRHSIEEVVRKLTDMISPDSATPVFGARKPRSLETEFVADAKRTESLIGWKSSVHLGDGLSKTVEWYRAHRTRDRQS